VSIRHVEAPGHYDGINPPSMEPHCTCGPYWSVVPPPPCPAHSVATPVYTALNGGNVRIISDEDVAAFLRLQKYPLKWLRDHGIEIIEEPAHD